MTTAGTLETLPFHAESAPLPTPSFEEALARMLFVAEHHWGLGWARGPAGCGRTTLLRCVARELRAQGRNVVWLPVEALRPGHFWSVLAAVLGRPCGAVNAASVARSLLVAGAACGRSVTILIDDLDRGLAGTFGMVETLARMTESSAPRPTVLITTTGELPVGLRSRVDLRTSLFPFTPQETACYLAERLATSEFQFDDDAMEAMVQRAGGNPAVTARLADLAVVAATAAGTVTVTAEMIRAAADILGTHDAVPAPLTGGRFST